MSIPTAIQAKEAKGTKEVKEYGDSEVTLHNELKHKSIFLRDFTTAAQMLRQVLRRCFDRCFGRCFGRCCADASAVAVMKGSTIVHGRKSAYGIAVLRAAYAAGL